MTTSLAQIVQVQRKPLSIDIDAPPSLDHGPTELPLGSILMEGDRCLGAYLPWEPTSHRDLWNALLPFRPSISTRTHGLTTRSATFGSLPRLELRSRDACQASALDRDNPLLFRLLADQAPRLEEIYRSLEPAVFAAHARKASSILEPWRLPSSVVFTGGIVNRDSNLGYHRDAGNFKGTWSAMICLRRATAGGELVLPEFGLHLPVHDRSVLLFNGQDWVHGVTPVERLSSEGARFTVVYYSVQRLWQCLQPEAEAASGAKIRTTRAIRRVGLDEEFQGSVT